MSHAMLLMLALTLFGQLGDADGGALQGNAAPADAAPAGGAAPASEITIAPEVPPPTLVGDDPAASGDSGQIGNGAGASDSSADVANPFDSAPAEPPAQTSTSPADGAEPPLAESTAPVSVPKPAELMRSLLQTPVADQLAGVPISLGDAVRSTSTRAEQTERVQAYWSLSAATAQYYLALQEAAELAALRQGVAAPSGAWDSAAVTLATRIQATRQSAIAAQIRLHGLTRSAAVVSLPLPADAPHCGRYNTRYTEIFVARQEPAARQLHDLLPLLHGELETAAALVFEARDWLNLVSERRDPATDGTGLLRSYELMALRRREFITAAWEYNNQIATYAELAAPDDVGPDRLVAMLIRASSRSGNSPTNGTAEVDSGVQPAGAFETMDPQQPAQRSDPSAATSPPRGARRTSAWRPFDRLRNRERSIVVRRLLLGDSRRGD